MANFVLHKIGSDRYLNMYRLELVPVTQATFFPTEQVADLFCTLCNSYQCKKVYRVAHMKRDHKAFRFYADSTPLKTTFNDRVDRDFPFLGLRISLLRMGDFYLHSNAKRVIRVIMYKSEFAAKQSKSYNIKPFPLFEHCIPPMNSEDEYSRYFTSFCDNIRDIQDSYSSMPELFSDSDE